MKELHIVPAQSPAHDDPWLTTKEAARYLNCHPNTLEKMRCRGDGPQYHKLVAKSVRYRKSDLDASMKGGTNVC